MALRPCLIDGCDGIARKPGTARGGAHSRANVAAAHLTCNTSKKDRVFT